MNKYFLNLISIFILTYVNSIKIYNSSNTLITITDSTIVPKEATCTTENRTVSLREDDKNPNLYYSPTCTRVMRCGGCCGSELLSCQPTEIEMLNFEVL